jgi:hypothetical protein
MTAEYEKSDSPRSWKLADGTEIPESVAITGMISLRDLLEKYGPLAAIDLTDIANGIQPKRSPFGDPKVMYTCEGFVDVSEDGKLYMHDVLCDIVRNAVHVDPNDPSNFLLTDPREPFPGFDR